MRGRGIRLAAALAVALLVSALAVKRAAAAPNAVELQAREAFAAGRYDEALELFAKLYAETLHPVYLRNIGRCHQKMRAPDKAIDAFQDYLAKSKRLTPDERMEVEGYIKEMEALRDEQARAAAPPPPPPPAPPPPPPAAVAPAAPLLLTAAAPPPRAEQESPVYKRWWFWTIIGVAVAGGVAAVLLAPVQTVKPSCPLETMGNCR